MDETAPPRIERLPSWLVSRAALRSHRLLSGAFAAEGVRGYDYRVLAALAEHGSLSQTELGRIAELDRSDVVASVDDLSAAQLVLRSVDDRDRRRNSISLTARGRRTLGRLDRVVAGVQDELLRSLSARQRAELVALLARVADPDEAAPAR
jgi:MarR family transcriptional regulator, lower aerobic nicotinate degradation pathway regulator